LTALEPHVPTGVRVPETPGSVETATTTEAEIEAIEELGRIAEVELEAGFREFVAAAARLEESHAALAARAERIERELAASNARLEAALAEREALLAALPVGVLVVPATEGRPQAANAEGERLVGGVPAAEIDELLQGVGSRDAVCAGRPLRVREAAMRDGARLLVVEDTSRERELEREVDRLDRLAGLSELALGIAHEIKNPLHGVMGFAELLTGAAGAGDSTRSVRYAARIREGLERVDAIVRALLAFARPGGRDEAPQAFGEVLAQAAVSAGLPTTCLDLRGVDSRAGGTAVLAAPIVRVFANLFRNALEAANGDVRIDVEARRLGSGLHVVVSDDGPGVPEALGATVFEPFVSSKPQGHGLGLPLVARVLAYLGGSIRLTNPGRGGARFELVVPAATQSSPVVNGEEVAHGG
jgi:signal transduction histidine kinase